MHWKALRAAIGQLRRHPRLNAVLTLTLVALLFAGAYVLVYATGGTQHAWPYMMLVPVLIAAARFRVAGGIAGGLIGGLLLGPVMPLDTTAGVAQDTGNWLVRIAFYTGLGGFTGMLFMLIRRQGQARERDARLDSDSALPNKTALIEALRSEDGERSGTPFLALARIVDLGEIMEAAGVNAADELVALLAQRIRHGIASDLEVYRFSASEIVVLRYADKPTEGMNAEDLLRVTEESAEVQGIPVHVELVIGSAGNVEPDTSAREMIRRARVALFTAIERQQALCQYSPEDERQTSETIRLLAGVRRGIDNGEFELYFQPKVCTATGEADGCEALVRWRNPDDGRIIPPGQFMPRVERSALIGPMTRFVAQSAFGFLERTKQRISINITARDLIDQNVIASIARMSAHDGTLAGRIEIEITEGAIVRDPAAAGQAIRQLRRCGFRVSLDDFGTGYSSFEYLRTLPLTGLKIDRAFVRDLEDDHKARRLMACMIDVGHALELEVVAEGVETPGQRDILGELGCDLLQGFYFAHPMAERQYLEWVGATA